jgi:hypothetical protein
MTPDPERLRGFEDYTAAWGMDPAARSGLSWSRMPSVLRLSHISEILPSSIRYIDAPLYSTPPSVGGGIRKSPVDVPRALQR